MQVHIVECPACGRSLTPDMKKCPACKNDVIITSFNSVASMPMPIVNKYANAYKKALAEVPNDPTLNNAIAMCYLKLTLTYDDSILTLEDAKNGDLFDTFESGASLSFDNGSDVTTTGNLLILTFSVKENAAEGTYPITIKCNRCFNLQEESVSVGVQNGTVTVRNTILGDANGDGEVDGRDLIRLRRYLANLDEETGVSTVEIFPGAEVTGNDEIDGRDLIRLRRYLANLDEDTGISTVTLG